MKRDEAIKNRTIPFVFSDETRDSYGTVLPVSGWDLSYFKKMGVALYNHSSGSDDPDNVIGSARAWVEGNQLLGEITFEDAETNPKAEKVFQKLLAGTIRGCSVGFRALKPGKWGEGDEALGQKNETYYYGQRSLVEISVTPFPANPNAKVRSQQEATEDGKEGEKIDFVVGSVRAFDPDIQENPKEEKQENTEAKEIESLRAEAKRSILLAEANIAEHF